MQYIIVSRHPAAVEFIRTEMPAFRDAPVLASATADDVRGAIVGGNLPLHLAAEAAIVVAVEFRGDAPRGAEYSIEEMRAAGAHLRAYQVRCPDLFTARAYGLADTSPHNRITPGQAMYDPGVMSR